MHKSVVFLALFLSLQCASAQDFQKSYDLPAGGYILIGNFLGDIKVSGYGGRTIEIRAVRKGPESDSIQIQDRSFGNRIELMTYFPHFRSHASSVDFDIRIPASVDYNFTRISSSGGNVEVSGVGGRLRAESVRGNIEIRDVRGIVSAKSVSGNVNVEIARGQIPDQMRFTSISGNIDVSAPRKLDLVVDMSSASGLLRTDFPIDVQERRYGPGRTARGTLGEGGRVLSISSVSGRVSLIQK